MKVENGWLTTELVLVSGRMDSLLDLRTYEWIDGGKSCFKGMLSANLQL
jgi:hypothetical protein